MKKLVTAIAIAAASLSAASVAESFEKLSGPEIRQRFSGMQLTDEVHWRDVYEYDGTFRSY